MTLVALIKELKLIARVHPEARNLPVWAVGDEDAFRIAFVGYDSGRRHTVKRVTLESALEP